MPIPGLSIKTKSPQIWKNRNFRDVRRKKTFFFTKQPIFTGRKKRPPKNLLKNAITFSVFAAFFVIILSIIFLVWIAKDLPNPNKIIDRSIALSTKIYDRTGEKLLYDIHGAEKRTFINLADIPKHLKHATLTAEDRNFYEHKGISFAGILRSAIKNIFTGSKVGGSTLTQQLVKNAILSPEKTYTRKVKEVIISYQIEKKFSKDEILQMYFNEIPYGSVAYGAEAASQTYFNKSLKDISLAESAILAALPQAPTYYSPYGSRTDALFGRQHWILNSMVELGYITKEEAELAKKEKIEFRKRGENIVAPHFVMYVKEYLTRKYGELTVEQGGLKVITTLDLYKQEIAEEIIREVTPKNAENFNANNAAMVAIDTKTGQILAMVGSKDYFADPAPENCLPGQNCTFDPQVNVAVRSRQPGSSFKPIVYTAAFKKGYTSETVLYDVVTKFKNYDGRDYEPKNYNLQENGPVTMRKALQGSLNIPAVKAIYLTGVDNVINLAENLGYTTFKNRSRFGLALVLGGGEVQLLEHTNAFATLAREGEWNPVTAILEIRDKNGDILEEYKKAEKKVLETEYARQINDVLSDNAARAYIFGERSNLWLGGRPVAVKTGTTNDYRDAWTLGYTPSLSVGVWVGNNNNKEMKRGADGSIVAAPIWNKFMSRVLGNTPFEPFNKPAPIETDKPVLNGTIIEGMKVKIDKISGKLATNLTPEHLVEEKNFRQIHSILHYLHKDDPLGNTPPNLNDPQYQRWEEAVQRWAEENNYTSEEVPTEHDDVHNIANKPKIKIISPKKNQTIDSRNISITIDTSAKRGIVKAEYYIDNRLIAETDSPPFNLEVYIGDPKIGRGFYQLKAVVYDDVENSNSDEIELNINFDKLPDTKINWQKPLDEDIIKIDKFPYAIKAEIKNHENIEKIDIYIKDIYGQKKYINTARSFLGNNFSLQWSNPPPVGTYKLFGEIKIIEGYSYWSDEIKITIE